MNAYRRPRRTDAAARPLSEGVEVRHRAPGRRLLAALVIPLAALIAGCSTASPGRGSGGPDSATAQRLDGAISKVMKQASIPGAIVGLWRPGHSPYLKTFGERSTSTKQPMSRDLYMRIGSQTKTFTVTAALQLVDQGKVGLDDPISTYVAGVPSGDDITVRELAGMRSGLFSYTADEDFAHALQSDPQRSFTPEQLLAYALRHPPVFAPGTGFQYSNTNTVLLGLVVEKVSGETLPTYLQKHVFTPLHLSHTSFPTDSAFPSPHADGYTEQTLDGKRADATDWNPAWGWAAGAMISTLDDLHAWAPALATGRLLAPATQAQRLKTVTMAGAPTNGYGLGIFNIDGWIGHNGSLPGYQTLAVYLPSQQATLVVLTNTDIGYKGNATTTLLGKAITEITSPQHVYSLPAAAQDPEPTPAAG
jgi:D-alanyl-D-alanine carboxypeptidase